MDTIVLDTNVFVAALISSDGASRELLRQCLLGNFKPLMGTALYLEYEDVVSREHVFSNSPVSAQDRFDLLDAFLSVCKWTKVYYLWRPNLADEADNHLIELAVAGQARCIATYNIRDLRRHELVFSDIQILNPAELLEVTSDGHVNN